jgi:hypothetical protein
MRRRRRRRRAAKRRLTQHASKGCGHVDAHMIPGKGTSHTLRSSIKNTFCKGGSNFQGCSASKS